MVRFKNRHLLIEFLSPQSLSSTITIAAPTAQSDLDALNPNGVDNADGDEEEEDDDDDTDLPLLPTVPFLVPITDESTRLKLGDESGSTVYRAIKQNILDVFGDEGWGRVSSSLKGMSVLAHIWHAARKAWRNDSLHNTATSYIFLRPAVSRTLWVISLFETT